MPYRRIFYRSGGLALLLGAFVFSLTKARGYVDSDDSLLGYFMFAGFTLWLIGVAALYSRYGPLSGRLGRTGLRMAGGGVGVGAGGRGGAVLALRTALGAPGQDRPQDGGSGRGGAGSGASLLLHDPAGPVRAGGFRRPRAHARAAPVRHRPAAQRGRAPPLDGPAPGGGAPRAP